MRLFSDILKGVGRNPKGDGKKKGGLKVHMFIDAVQSMFVQCPLSTALLNLLTCQTHPLGADARIAQIQTGIRFSRNAV